ncbi:MAG: ATP-dependent helicase [Candidatus Limnocylindria bacterium]
MAVGSSRAPASTKVPRWLDAVCEGLDAEQRAAALLPDGPAQIIAPAGSGKTTTLVARLGALLSRGAEPAKILVLSFNRNAASELGRRVQSRLVPIVSDARAIEVRTLHALARQILLDGGRPATPIPDRLPLLRAARRECAGRRAPEAPPLPEVGELDSLIAAAKIEDRSLPPDVAEIAEVYQRLLSGRGQIDFDDLVVGAVRLLEGSATLRRRWQARYDHLLVDEFQDVDAAQVRLIAILAQPGRSLFAVGDDDQTIYAWRLADVRRMLRFTDHYPDARRVVLGANYRCPPAVVRHARQLIEVNRERISKPIAAGRPDEAADAVAAVDTSGAAAPSQLVAMATALSGPEERLCFLARTRAELGPIGLALLHAGVPHASSLPSPLDAMPVVALVAALQRGPADAEPFETLRALRRANGWNRAAMDDALSDEDHAALDAMQSWAAGVASIGDFVSGFEEARRRLLALRDPEAPIELVTVHGAKGREWETVVVIGFEEERFPNRRALVESAAPERALEEERRLAYVAVTRATRRLILAFDPARPSRFLAEMQLTIRPSARQR